MNNFQNSTITAIATPSGTGGIGIIRISGPDATNIIYRIFRKKNSRSIETIESHKIYFGEIFDPETGYTIDEVIMFSMLSPSSYTKEDVVEVQGHGGILILKSILNIILGNGAVLAEPGEFTKRAFLNGRIDLTQAESVIDIINSNSTTSLQIGISQLKGNLLSLINSTRNSLIEKLTEIEAMIDFPDDVEDNFDPNEISLFLQDAALLKLDNLLSNYDDFLPIRDGINISIIGSPNVGKSSLMNCLVEKDKSIVTSIPGTTRDLIDDHLFIHGLPVILSDTAGLHSTSDLVENIGIQKTSARIIESDIILFVIDINQGITQNEKDIYKLVKDSNYFIVLNKCDLVSESFQGDLSGFDNYIDKIKISAKFHVGIDDLKNSIKNYCGFAQIEVNDKIIPNLRQKCNIQQATSKIHSAISSLNNNDPPELIAIDINDAIKYLGEVIGQTHNIDILDNIFSRFCIGK